MSESKTTVQEAHRQLSNDGSQAYMNRMFCSTQERIAYVLKTSLGQITLGKYDTTSDLFLYKIFGLVPTQFAKANAGLLIYDMINDPLTAAIVDNMRSRWGKFKPFQWMALLPSLVLGIITCLIPLLNFNPNYSEGNKLWIYMAVLYANETVGALFSGGGYIDRVFTPNPNERTSLLTSGKFVEDLFGKLPEQIAGIVIDLILNGAVSINLIKFYVIIKSVVWVIAQAPNIYWTVVSKERVAQSEKPPNPIHGILAVFKNKPLLLFTLTGFIDDIEVGTDLTLYFSEVLHFTMLPTIAGIPGSPVSYASYAFVPKFRQKFSTKGLWLLQRSSVLVSQVLFLLTGLVGGKNGGWYTKKLPMAIAFGLGNCLEMAFYATKKIIGDEINYEVLDYCEWKNGYRVEATINLLSSYITKVKNIFLKLINAWLLEKWAGYESGFTAVQSVDTQFKMFIAASGPKLIFDTLCLIPMFFYNIDKNTRERMYLDLEQRRSETAARIKELSDLEADVKQDETAQ